MGARDEMKGHAREVVQNAGKKKKRVWFIRWRMWLNYLLANIQKDQGVIPKNIGDKILISNNMFVTKYFMSSIIQISGDSYSFGWVFDRSFEKRRLFCFS